MSVLAVVFLFCVPGGAVLSVLVGEATGLSCPPLIEWLLVLACAWIATLVMVSSWAFLRSIGWAFALTGYAMLANALSPERTLGRQAAWLAFAALAGAVLGVFGPRGNNVFLFVRRRPGAPREETGTRRWEPPLPQMRLRSLLLLVTVACLVLGLFTRESRMSLQQRRIADAVLAAGGQVHFGSVRGIPTAGLERVEALLARDWLLGKEYRQQLTYVSLGPGVGDAELRSLGLEALPELYTLDLGTSQISDEGLAYVRRLRRVGWLVLPPATTDAGLAHLEGWTGVSELDLGSAAISDAGLAHLRGMTGLESLVLRGPAITDAGLVHLRDLQGLRHLSLVGTSLSDNGLRHFQGLRNLETLRISGAAITAAGLENLADVPGLKFVSLHRTQVSPAGLKGVKRPLPSVIIER